MMNCGVGLAPTMRLSPGGAPLEGVGVPEDRIDQRAILAGEIELHAVIQGVVERDLGNRDVDRDLQFWSVEFVQRALDRSVIFVVGVNQNRIVDGVGGNAHAWQQRGPAAP